jgi:hypothetical protein
MHGKPNLGWKPLFKQILFSFLLTLIKCVFLEMPKEQKYYIENKKISHFVIKIKNNYQVTNI